VLQVSQWIATAGAIGVGSILKTEPRKWGGILEKGCRWVQHSAWWLVIVFGAITLVSKALCPWVGPPWAWQGMQKLLDRFRDEAFEMGDEAAFHEHRVTLCKFTRWLWWVRPFRSPYWPWGNGRVPWSGGLVPVATSGRTTQRTNTLFLAPDDADNAEGLPG
jgi:hypothetical protein